MIQYYPQAPVIPTAFLAAQPHVADRVALAASGRLTSSLGAEVTHG